MYKEILNLKGHPNHITGSKVMALLGGFCLLVEMPCIDLDISHFLIIRAPLGWLEVPYIDLDISHLSSTQAP